MKLFWDYNLATNEWKYLRQERFYLISLLYSQFLLSEEIDLEKIFNTEKELLSREYRKIVEIKETFNWIKKLISAHFKKANNWDNLLPIIKAILVFGVYEMKKIDPPIALSEAIEISKYLIRPQETKMINAILDKISKLIEGTNETKRVNQTLEEK